MAKILSWHGPTFDEMPVVIKTSFVLLWKGMGDVPPPLTPEQTMEALKLYRHLMALRHNGYTAAEVHLDSGLGVRPIGKRVDIAPDRSSAILTPI